MREINRENEYFGIFSGSYSTKKFAVPQAPERYSHLDIPEKGYQENWEPIHFIKLKDQGPLPDFVCTDICGRVCSPKLREIIEDHLTKDDNSIQWLPMLIEDQETGDAVEYYYLHFPEVCNTLDLQRSTFSSLGVARQVVFSHPKVANRSVFNCRGGEEYTTVSKDLKESLFREGCTGIRVEPAHVNNEVDERKIL